MAQGVHLGKVWSKKLFAAIGAAVGRARGKADLKHASAEDDEMLIGGGVSACAAGLVRSRSREITLATPR